MVYDDQDPLLKQICDFVLLNSERIKQELKCLDLDVKKWILDLTTTSLFSLLTEWGKDYQELICYCDNSKPLARNQDILNNIGNNQDEFAKLHEKNFMSYNLKEPINFVDSAQVYGIQLADVIAGVSSYVFNRNNNDEYTSNWRVTIENHIIADKSIISNSEFINDKCFKLNCFLLFELVRRSNDGTNLTEDIDKYIESLAYII